MPRPVRKCRKPIAYATKPKPRATKKTYGGMRQRVGVLALGFHRALMEASMAFSVGLLPFRANDKEGWESLALSRSRHAKQISVATRLLIKSWGELDKTRKTTEDALRAIGAWSKNT